MPGEPPEAGRAKECLLPKSLQRKGPWRLFDWRILASRSLDGNLGWQPQEAHPTVNIKLSLLIQQKQVSEVWRQTDYDPIDPVLPPRAALFGLPKPLPCCCLQLLCSLLAMPETETPNNQIKQKANIHLPSFLGLGTGRFNSN